jgi:hypothetical protein
MTDTDDRLTKPSKRVRTAFWWLFFLLPVTGILQPLQQHQSLPNEYDEKRHELLTSHRVCETDAAGMQHNCAEIADAWRDKKSGERFTRADFAVHRREGAARAAVVAFAYGLIGCFAFAYFHRDEGEHSFYKYLGMTVCADLALAFYGFLMLAF